MLDTEKTAKISATSIALEWNTDTYTPHVYSVHVHHCRQNPVGCDSFATASELSQQ